MITTRQFLAIPPTSWKVYCLFLRLIDSQGRCSYSARQLAQLLDISRPTVQRAITDLQTRGLVSILVRQGSVCIYQVDMDALCSPEIQPATSPVMHASPMMPSDNPADPAGAPENADDPALLTPTGATSPVIPRPAGGLPMTEQEFLARIAELVALDAATPAPTP